MNPPPEPSRASTSRSFAVNRRTERTTYVLLVMVLLLTFGYGWSVDFVTFDGERTIYTVQCAAASWSGSTCLSSLRLGPRYRFRTLKPHKEVLFWTVGSTEPAGKLRGCDVEGGRNWTCSAVEGPVQPIAMSMVHGEPTLDADANARGIRPISKLRWLLTRVGMPLGNTAAQK